MRQDILPEGQVNVEPKRLWTGDHLKNLGLGTLQAACGSGTPIAILLDTRPSQQYFSRHSLASNEIYEKCEKSTKSWNLSTLDFVTDGVFVCVSVTMIFDPIREVKVQQLFLSTIWLESDIRNSKAEHLPNLLKAKWCVCGTCQTISSINV